MRYCPYCGAELADETYLFCLECGKAIPKQEQSKEASRKTVKRKRNRKVKKYRVQGEKIQLRDKTISKTPELEEDGYDGYYDDIIPVDEGKITQGIDKEVLKRIVGLIIGVVIIICACVAIMYML